ncbi:MAG: hypothetical protein CME81_07050 [Halomonas sp.]|nr:hypothetical protein [Halomonas sp.]|tara:strand:- start:28896 stop:29099 length:204 start_codon:yes stop_codon:yes gene_type:complete
MVVVRNTFGEVGAETLARPGLKKLNKLNKRALKKFAALYQKVPAIVFVWTLKKLGQGPLNTQSLLTP